MQNTKYPIFTDGWAYRSDEDFRKESNKNAYEELKEKFKTKNVTNFSYNENTLEENDLVYEVESEHNTFDTYKVLKADERLSADEILLIIGGGCLCFGGRKFDDGIHFNINTD